MERSLVFFTAFYFKSELEEDEKPIAPSWANEDPSNTNYFFQRNTFERTKLQRKLDEEARKNEEDDWISTST